MGWGKMESRITELRGEIGRDPKAAASAIRDTLQIATRPRDRVRLLGLLAASHRHRQDWTRAEEVILHSLSGLRRIKATNAYNQLIELLEWVVRSPQRAAEMRSKLQAQAPSSLSFCSAQGR